MRGRLVVTVEDLRLKFEGSTRLGQSRSGWGADDLLLLDVRGLDPHDHCPEKAAGDPAKIDKTLRELESNPDLVRDVALLWISQASSDPTRQSAIEGAIKGADREMPIMEIGAITLVALYAIYILSPPKPKEITWILREKPDGTYEEEVAGKYDTFDAPAKALTSLFSEGAKEG